ncbi:MAG: DUF2461 domain-containing protein [Actinomycetota bacterium]
MTPPRRMSAAAFDLLADLERNNRRDWFEARREEFAAIVVDPFVEVLEAASRELTEGVWPVSGGRRTVFRQLRDQRYAKAEPYATAVRALLTTTGTKPTHEACVHVEVSAAGGFVGAGLHRPSAASFAPVRRRILDEPDRWRDVVDRLHAAGQDLVDDRLVRMPRGFEADAGHEVADAVRLRSLEVMRRLTGDDWLDGSVVPMIVDVVRASMPLLRFVNEVDRSTTE